MICRSNSCAISVVTGTLDIILLTSHFSGVGKETQSAHMLNSFEKIGTLFYVTCRRSCECFVS